MSTALQRALASILIILVGYTLKRLGLFGKNDYSIAAKICLNVTLPAAIITGFSTYERDLSLFLIVVLGALANAVMLIIAWLATIRVQKRERLFHIFAMPGLQIGTFTLPFIGNILGPFGILVTCMFDSGNALFASGGTYAIVSSSPQFSGGEKLTMPALFKRICSNTPFDVYVLSMLWVFFGLPIPKEVLTFIAPAAAANPFLAMFMIGLMIEPRLSHAELAATAKTLIARYALSVVMALFFYFCTPFPLIARQALALIAFSPISALAPIFTDRCGGDGALSSFAETISIMISLAAMTICMVLLGL